MGVHAWEFSVQSDKFLQSKDFRIDGHSLFSMALQRKQSYCNNPRQCETYRERDLIQSLVIYTLTHNQNFNSVALEMKLDHEPAYSFGDNKIWIQGSSLIIQPEKHNQDLFLAILWPSIQAKALRQFGPELLVSSLERVPNTRSQDPEEFDQEFDTFYSLFCYIYYWNNPLFLPSKQGPKLHLRTLELQTTKFALTQLIPAEFFVSFDYLFRLLARSYIITVMRLYTRVSNLPGNILSDFINQFNPNQRQLPPPIEFTDQLDEVENDLITGCVQYILEKGNLHHFLSDTGQEYLMSRRQLGKYSHHSSGSQYKKLKQHINKLVRVGIFKEISISNHDISRTSAKYLYTLNPDHPYTKILLEFGLDK